MRHQTNATICMLALITIALSPACTDPETTPDPGEVIITTPDADMSTPPREDMPDSDPPEDDMAMPLPDMMKPDEEDMGAPDMPEDEDMAVVAMRTVESYDVWSEEEHANRAVDPRMTHTVNQFSSDSNLWTMMKMRENSNSLWRVFRAVSHKEPQGGRHAYAVSLAENGWQWKLVGTYLSLDEEAMDVSLTIGVPSEDILKPGFEWPVALVSIPMSELDDIFYGVIPAVEGSDEVIDGITWRQFFGTMPSGAAGRALIFGENPSNKVFYVKQPSAVPGTSMPGGLKAYRPIEPLELSSAKRASLSSLFSNNGRSPQPPSSHPHRL